jgi:hypothetical protein
LPLSLDALRTNLCQQSLGYQLLDYLAKDTGGLTCFAQDHYVSVSTVQRRMKQLRPLLAAFHVDVGRHPFQLIGSEMHIRYLLYAAYWLAYRGTHWPLDLVDQRAIKALYIDAGVTRRSAVGKAQALLFVGVCNLRLANGHQLPVNDQLLAMTQLLSKQRRDALAMNGQVDNYEIGFRYLCDTLLLDFEERLPAKFRAVPLAQAPIATFLEVVTHTLAVAGVKMTPILSDNLWRLAFAVAVFGDVTVHLRLLGRTQQAHGALFDALRESIQQHTAAVFQPVATELAQVIGGLVQPPQPLVVSETAYLIQTGQTKIVDGLA